MKAMELLNGKAKELFEKWLENQDVSPYKVIFYDIPIIVQQSYIIQWLDSVGIHIEFEVIDPIDLKFNYCVFCNDNFRTDKGRFLRIGNRNYKTRQEATTEAIKKAVELINESNGK